MKKASAIFAVILTIMCLVTTGAVICGYTHQWVMAAGSGLVAATLWAEVLQKENPGKSTN